MSDSIKTRTIAYFQNGLGNLLCLTPAFSALAMMDASKKIDIALYDPWKDSRRPAVELLCKSLPFVNRVLVYPKDKKEFRGYLVWYYVAHSENNDLMHLFRVNADIKSYSFDTWKSEGVHEIDYCMDHVYRRGYTGATPLQQMPIADEPVLDITDKRLKIGICNGGFGHLRSQKVWPHFPMLADQLHSVCKVKIIKIGNGKELSDVNTYDIDFVNKLNILQTAKVISQLDLFITTDTGCMHIGDALRVPMIVLFGGSSVAKNGPVNGTSTVLKSGAACQPCQGRPVFNDCIVTECMRNLSVKCVLETVKRKRRI